MKKLIFLLFVIFSLSACSVYEDVYFQKDGSVKYQMMVDAGEILNMMPDFEIKMPDNLPTDSIISIAQMIKDSIADITPDIQRDLDNIAPLCIKLENNIADKKLGISVYGDFKNVDALNQAFASAAKLQEKQKEQSDSKTSNMSPFVLDGANAIHWDGKTMRRVVDVAENDEGEEQVEGEESDNDMSSNFFSKGKMIVRYHFPTEVENISNPDAVMSQDRKTVIIEYSGSSFTNPKKGDLDIEIKMKRK